MLFLVVFWLVDCVSIQIYASLTRFKEKMIKCLQEFCSALHRDLLKVPISNECLSRVCQQLITTSTNRVSSLTLSVIYFAQKLLGKTLHFMSNWQKWKMLKLV